MFLFLGASESPANAVILPKGYVKALRKGGNFQKAILPNLHVVEESKSQSQSSLNFEKVTQSSSLNLKRESTGIYQASDSADSKEALQSFILSECDAARVDSKGPQRSLQSGSSFNVRREQAGIEDSDSTNSKDALQVRKPHPVQLCNIELEYIKYYKALEKELTQARNLKELADLQRKTQESMDTFEDSMGYTKGNVLKLFLELSGKIDAKIRKLGVKR
ncbi:MAG: hypothetical protein H6850_01915 [Alphaproteobacteria bacterium]|nr:MAG: hypothetical protein H6850_01915 [Alphaproteobacteria bacterium]